MNVETFNMDDTSTVSTFNVNDSGNMTHYGQNGTCIKEDKILLIFTLWEFLDKLLALATNGGTILIMYLHRHDMLEIPSNIFMGCLTMADLASVLALPFNVASTYLSHTWGWTVSCFLTIYITYATSMINTVTLCVIAVDRLIYIVYPLQYHLKMPVTRALCISISLWVFCSVYSLIVIYLGYTDAYHLGGIARPCTPTISVRGRPSPFALFLQIPFLVFVPVTIGSYIKVGLVALKQRRLVAASGGAQEQAAGPDYKITKVMLNVLSVYILCFLLVIVTNPLRKYMYAQGDTCGVVRRVVTLIWHINTWLNPIIYAWKSQKFRRYVRGIFNRNQVHDADFNLV